MLLGIGLGFGLVFDLCQGVDTASDAPLDADNPDAPDPTDPPDDDDVEQRVITNDIDNALIIDRSDDDLEMLCHHGIDRLYEANGSSILQGGAGADVLFNNLGDDTLNLPKRATDPVDLDQLSLVDRDDGSVLVSYNGAGLAVLENIATDQLRPENITFRTN